MSNVTQYDPNAGSLPVWNPGAALPAYMQQGADELPSNMIERNTTPSLLVTGKVWTVSKDGNKTPLTTQNLEGDTIPASVMRMVVLDLAQRRGRAYYKGAYDPDKAAQPDCWSTDGEAPDSNVKEKVCGTCKACPMAAKGSRIQDGEERVACAQHRIIAVVPFADITSDPLRLKLAVTSDWDKEQTEHGWFAFQQYMDYLKANGVPHSGMVVTKAKFDANAAYPKVLFGVDRPLTQEEYAQMKTALTNPKLAEIIADKWTPAGGNGVIADQSDTRPSDGLPPKPTDPAHLAHEGTEHEVWWDGSAWVKPWLGAKAPEPATPAPAAGATQAASTPAVATVAPEQSAPASTAGAVQEAQTTGQPTADPVVHTTQIVDVRPAPTEDSHYHAKGTPDEQWWDGAAWVKPWATVAPEPAPAAPPPPAPAPAAPAAPAARPAPTDAGHYHAKGTPEEMWWNGAEWEKPWGPLVQPAAAPAAPAAPSSPEAGASSAPAGDGMTPELSALMTKWN